MGRTTGDLLVVRGIYIYIYIKKGEKMLGTSFRKILRAFVKTII